MPILNGLDITGGRPALSALVLVPTRELAMQVSEAIFKYGRVLGVQVVPIYGGQPIGRQLQALDRGVHVVVGTPGPRPRPHRPGRRCVSTRVHTVVLDEADEMLDMGFADDIESILQELPDERQTVLFSATMPPRITGIAKRYLRDPVRITIARGRHERRTGAGAPDAPTSCSAPTRRRRWAASSTSRHRRPPSSSAGRASRSTS